MHPKIAVVEPDRETGLSRVVSQAAGSILPPATYDVVRVLPADLPSTLSGGVDLVIVDLRMPDQDALRVLHALKAEAKNSAVPVLVLSAETLAPKDVAEKIQPFLSKLSLAATRATPERDRGEWRTVDLEDVAKGMGITHAALAQILGTSERNLARWIAGETAPRATREAKVQELKYIYYLLKRALKDEAISRYLSQPNPELKGRTALMVLRAGDFHSVEADLLQLIEGVYV